MNKLKAYKEAKEALGIIQDNMVHSENSGCSDFQGDGWTKDQQDTLNDMISTLDEFIDWHETPADKRKSQSTGV